MHCDDKEQKIDNIDRILELDGDLSEAQRSKLLEIADKCPVHKTLSTQTDIKTTLKEQKNSMQ
jgi:putative redox protein